MSADQVAPVVRVVKTEPDLDELCRQIRSILLSHVAFGPCMVAPLLSGEVVPASLEELQRHGPQLRMVLTLVAEPLPLDPNDPSCFKALEPP
jgi:hypothetical protein